jgi:uncharacterized protein YbjT (DUF2867 family)
MTILVTGGTGTLGHPTVRMLRIAGHETWALSRRAGVGRRVGDLSTGAGLEAALDGVDTVLHLANGQLKESAHTGVLIDALRDRDIRHLLYISIVGVDRNPFPYYRQKLASERRVEESGIPFTILRATQFHNLLASLLKAQRRLPAVIVPRIPVQPIDVGEVATRIVELVEGGPSGHELDIEGPQQRSFEEFAKEWFTAHGAPDKRIWGMSLPGDTMRAFQSGASLGKLPGYGRGTFAEFATADAAKTAAAVGSAPAKPADSTEEQQKP